MQLKFSNFNIKLLIMFWSNTILFTMFFFKFYCPIYSFYLQILMQDILMELIVALFIDKLTFHESIFNIFIDQIS